MNHQPIMSFYGIKNTQPALQARIKCAATFRGIIIFDRNLNDLLPFFYTQREVKRRYFENRTILPLKTNNKIVPLLLAENGLSVGAVTRQKNSHLVGYFVFPRHNHSNEVMEFLRYVNYWLNKELLLDKMSILK